MRAHDGCQCIAGVACLFIEALVFIDAEMQRHALIAPDAILERPTTGVSLYRYCHCYSSVITNGHLVMKRRCYPIITV